MVLDSKTVWEPKGEKSFDNVTDAPYSFSTKDIGNYITGPQLCDALPGYFSTELENLLRNPPKFEGVYIITSITKDGVEIEGNIPEDKATKASDV